MITDEKIRGEIEDYLQERHSNYLDGVIEFADDAANEDSGIEATSTDAPAGR